MRGKKRRRQHSNEATSTAKKQTNIRDFLPDNDLNEICRNFPTANSYEVLAPSTTHEEPAGIVDGPQLASSLCMKEQMEQTLESLQKTSPELSQSPAQLNKDREALELLICQTELITHTITNLYKRLDGIEKKLEKVFGLFSCPPSLPQLNNIANSAHPCPSVQANLAQKQVRCLPNQVQNSSLQLQNSKLAVLVGNHPLNYNKWADKHSVTNSLTQLLGQTLRPVDIVDISWLPSGPYMRRMVINFRSAHFVAKILKLRNRTRKWYIYFTRVFTNLTRTPLCTRIGAVGVDAGPVRHKEQIDGGMEPGSITPQGVASLPANDLIDFLHPPLGTLVSTCNEPGIGLPKQDQSEMLSSSYASMPELEASIILSPIRNQDPQLLSNFDPLAVPTQDAAVDLLPVQPIRVGKTLALRKPAEHHDTSAEQHDICNGVIEDPLGQINLLAPQLKLSHLSRDQRPQTWNHQAGQIEEEPSSGASNHRKRD